MKGPRHRDDDPLYRAWVRSQNRRDAASFIVAPTLFEKLEERAKKNGTTVYDELLKAAKPKKDDDG